MVERIREDGPEWLGAVLIAVALGFGLSLWIAVGWIGLWLFVSAVLRQMYGGDDAEE